MPRVLFASDACGVGGGELVTLERACALRSRGSHVHLLAPSGSFATRAQGSGIVVHTSPRRRGRRALDTLLKDISPCICHVVTYGALTRQVSRRAARQGIPVVVSVSVLGFPGGLRSRSFVRSAQLVLVPSRTVRDDLQSRVDLPHIEVLPDVPYDAQERAPRREPFAATDSTRCRVGWVGRLDPVKRLEDTIVAFAVVSAALPDVELRIAAGSSSFGSVSAEQYRARIWHLIVSLGIQTNIDWQEDITDVYSFLQSVDVVVNSSARETFSRTTFEAMLMARPVIATRASAITELIDDRVNGILVEVGDTEALARSLLELIKDPESAIQFGTAARRSAVSLAKAAAPMERLLELYERLKAPPATKSPKERRRIIGR